MKTPVPSWLVVPARWAMALAAVLAACLAVYLALVRYPAALPVDAAPELFSAGRAMAYLERLCVAPRPWRHNAAARQYLLETLAGMGLQPEVQTHTSVVTYNDPVSNVVVRLPGRGAAGAGSAAAAGDPSANPAILFLAHYDTMPQTPGAGDDGSGVTVLMELARTLHNNPPLRNDVIVLFTDGEEFGLMGADAFASYHPAAGAVRVVINMEGVMRGPLVIFASSADNGWLMAQVRRSGAFLGHAPYLFSRPEWLMGGSDLSPFLYKGYPGLGMFSIYSNNQNHSPDDVPAGIDLGGLQSSGEALLRLARQLGEHEFPPAGARPGAPGGLPPAPLPAPAAAPVVYFNLLRATATYPAAWVVPLSLLAALLSFMACLAARRRAGAPSAQSVHNPLTAPLTALYMAGLSVLLPLLLTYTWRAWQLRGLEGAWRSTLMYIWEMTQPHDRVRLPNDGWILGGYLLLALLLAGVGLWAPLRRLGRRPVRAGALLVWTGLALLTAWLLPMLNYVFLWPALAWAGVMWLEARTADKLGAATLAAAGAIFLTLVLLLPVLYMLYLSTVMTTLFVTSALAVLGGCLVWPELLAGPLAAAGG